jgi:hypothetical protein
MTFTTIWKFQIKVRDEFQHINMPKGAKILHLEAVNMDTIWIWASIPDEKAPLVTRLFQTYGTGHDMPLAESGDGKYLGTVTPFPLVWHVFEVV